MIYRWGQSFFGLGQGALEIMIFDQRLGVPTLNSPFDVATGKQQVLAG
jgi:hypothetical protein